MATDSAPSTESEPEDRYRLRLEAHSYNGDIGPKVTDQLNHLAQDLTDQWFQAVKRLNGVNPVAHRNFPHIYTRRSEEAYVGTTTFTWDSP